MFSSRLLATVFAPFVSGLVPAAVGNKPHRQNPNIIEFVDVNVVPMDEERVLTAQTVIVRDGRIAAIGAASGIAIPEAHSELPIRF